MRIDVEDLFHVLLELGSVMAQEIDRSQKAYRLSRFRIDGQHFLDFFLGFVVLLGIDVLSCDEQMSIDEVGIGLHGAFERARRLFRLAIGKGAGHTDKSFRHVRIDLQSVLIAGNRFRFVVFLC